MPESQGLGWFIDPGSTRVERYWDANGPTDEVRFRKPVAADAPEVPIPPPPGALQPQPEETFSQRQRRQPFWWGAPWPVLVFRWGVTLMAIVLIVYDRSVGGLISWPALAVVALTLALFGLRRFLASHGLTLEEFLLRITKQ